ncbi:hypothetical protein LQZ18_08855 [Lachnospiraceae bacterium ZAX-1]
MENEPDIQMTSFDTMVQSRQMQMLKAAIPYINLAQQRMLSVYVKYLELQRTMQIFGSPQTSLQMCSVTDRNEAPIQMLNDIRVFCNDTEKESIDMIMSFLQMFSTYETLF